MDPRIGSCLPILWQQGHFESATLEGSRIRGRCPLPMISCYWHPGLLPPSLHGLHTTYWADPGGGCAISLRYFKSCPAVPMDPSNWCPLWPPINVVMSCFPRLLHKGETFRVLMARLLLLPPTGANVQKAKVRSTLRRIILRMSWRVQRRPGLEHVLVCIYAIQFWTVNWMWPENNWSFAFSCILYVRLPFVDIVSEAQWKLLWELLEAIVLR